MSTIGFGTWFTTDEPKWKEDLNSCPDTVIAETGLSREKLVQVLEIMYEARIIR